MAITGFRYLVNERGDGVTVQEVGRIVYDDLDEVGVVTESGQHQLSDEALIEPTLCGAIPRSPVRPPHQSVVAGM